MAEIIGLTRAGITRPSITMGERLHGITVALTAAHVFVLTFRGQDATLHETIDVIESALASADLLAVEMGQMVEYVRRELNPHLLW